MKSPIAFIKKQMNRKFIKACREEHVFIYTLVCALLTDRMGAGAAIGFRFAWSYLDQAVLGFAGAQTALYETYPVNMYWLSGGNGGLMCGLLTTLMLCAAAVMLVRGRMHEYLPVRKESGRRTAW